MREIHILHSAKCTASQDPTELDRISTLPNGIRVATEALPGVFSGIGVYVDAGSRYENDDLRGVSHIMDRLAFKSTKRKTAQAMFEAQEELGGNIHCASSREILMYQVATFNKAVPSAMGLLAETVRDPLITEGEVQEQLEGANYEISEIWSKPELILPELVHVAAYKDNTLGNPLLCPQERLEQMNRTTFDRYRQQLYHPERIVVAFAGVDHQEALQLSERYFGDWERNSSQSTHSSQPNIPSPELTETSGKIPHPSVHPSGQDSSRLLSKMPLIKNLSTSAPHQANVSSGILDPSSSSGANINLTAPSHYTGGFLSLPAIPPPANPALPRLSHIHLAFEALSISSRDIYALATLQTILGGGGSFSAGGPGKGMYSRLYSNVLNQYGWVESAVAFNHSYTDSGLFGISASCVPSKVSSMLEVMCRELNALTLPAGSSQSLQDEEVKRAKNQLRSSLLMNLESRMVELEDLGRQVQSFGVKVSVWEMCRMIDSLTIDDLRRVAAEVVKGIVENAGKGSGAPTVVLQEGLEDGETEKKGGGFEWDQIQQRIAKWGLGRS